MSMTHEEKGRILDEYKASKQKLAAAVEKATKMITNLESAAAALKPVLSGRSPSMMASNLPSQEEYAQIIQDLSMAHRDYYECSKLWESIRPKE